MKIKNKSTLAVTPVFLVVAACMIAAAISPATAQADNGARSSIILKTQKGSPATLVYAGLPLMASLEAEPGGTVAATWKVFNASGEDVTAEFLTGQETGSPVFTAPAESGAGVYILQSETGAGESASASRAYIRVYSVDNRPPFNSISAPVLKGEVPLQLSLSCPAFDSDGSIASRCWEYETTDGTQEKCIEGDTPFAIEYATPGTYRIRCVVKDDMGAVGFAETTALALAEGETKAGGANRPPEIEAAYAALPGMEYANKVALVAIASDADYDSLAIQWQVPVGDIDSPDSPIALWTVPSDPGKYTADVSVSDGVNEPVKSFISITVREENQNAPTAQTPAQGEAQAETAKKETAPPAPVMIPVGRLPFEISVDDKLGRAYVSNSGSNSVSVIDTAGNKVIGNYTTDGLPKGVAINSFTGRVYVVSSGGQSINIFDGRTGIEIEDDIRTGTDNPVHVEVDTRRDVYFVSHSTISSGIVVEMNAVSNQPGAAVGVGSGASGMAVNELTGRVYVANTTDATVSVIDSSTMSVISTISVDSGPTEIVINENTNRVYVSCADEGTVRVIDGASNLVFASLNVGSKPLGMHLDTKTDRLYVANKRSDSISVINVVSETVIDEIKVGKSPVDVAVDSALNRMFVLLENDGTVESIDLEK